MAEKPDLGRNIDHAADETPPLPGWWFAGVGAAIVGCVALFGLALVRDSVILGFASLLVPLLAYPALHVALKRHHAKEQR